MCSSSKPSMPKPKPLTLKAPPEETEVRLGSTSDETRKRKKRTALGTRQLMIPTSSGANTTGGSGLSI